jgi:hypothetical protein
MKFWNQKFSKHIKERETTKKHQAKTQNIHCLTKNTNIKIDDGKGDFKQV